MDPSSPVSSQNSDAQYWSDEDVTFLNHNSTLPSLPVPEPQSISTHVTKKSKGISKKSQLTPRVALYIPPHLQKYQREAASLKKSNPVIETPPLVDSKQLKLNNALYSKAKEKIKIYQQKQNSILSLVGVARNVPSGSMQIKTKRKCGKLPDNLWSREIQEQYQLKNSSHEQFLKTGSEIDLKKSKQAKCKLRQLIRVARSRLKPTESNPYKVIAVDHAKFYGEEMTETENSTEGANNVSLEENMSDISSHEDEEPHDSSFYFSMKRRMNSRLEWSEAILKYNSDPSYLKSRSGLVKEELVISDNDCDITVEDEDSDDDCRERRGRQREYNRTPTGGSESETSSRRSGQEIAINSSDNEYLNQQFLRQQHDFERQQKFNQISSESGGRDHSIFSRPEESRMNFLLDKTRDSSDEKSFNKTLKDYRLHDLNRYKNNSAHQDFDTLLSELREPLSTETTPEPETSKSSMPCPTEPFIESVRYQKPLPRSIVRERIVSGFVDRKILYGGRSLSRYEQYDRNYENVARYGGFDQMNAGHSKYPPQFSGRLSPYSERKALKESARGVRRYPEENRSRERRYPPELHNYKRREAMDTSMIKEGISHYPPQDKSRTRDKRQERSSSRSSSRKRRREEDRIHEGKHKKKRR